MKKEKKRELTLKQLERRNNIATKTQNIAIIIDLIGLSIIAILTIPCKDNQAIGIILLIALIHSTLWFGVNLISMKLAEKYKYKISIKEKAIRVNVIKKVAKDDNIEEFVTLKDKKIITDILSKNITKIVIDNIDESNFVTSIQLSDTTWQQNIYISIEKLISVLDENSKKEMLNHLIKDIRIGNLKEKTVEVTINGQGFCYTNTQATDDELFEMFELKEDE